MTGRISFSLSPFPPSLSLSLCLYIFFHLVLVAWLQLWLQRTAKRGSVCKMERGMRDNWPIIVDRDDTRVLSRNYSRTVARGRIQFGIASTLTGKKRDETRTGRMLKELWRRMGDPSQQRAWSLSWFFGFADPDSAAALLVDGSALGAQIPGNDLFNVRECQLVPS